jgi:hypothetical protein
METGKKRQSPDSNEKTLSPKRRKLEIPLSELRVGADDQPKIYHCLRQQMLFPDDLCRFMIRYETTHAYELDAKDAWRFYKHLPTFFLKLNSDQMRTFLHVILVFGHSSHNWNAAFHPLLFDKIRSSPAKQKLIDILCKSEILRPYMNWHWLSNGSSLIDLAIRSNLSQIVRSVYRHSHAECQNLSVLKSEYTLISILLTKNTEMFRDFLDNVEIDGSGMDLISLYPILKDVYALSPSKSRLLPHIAKACARIETYRNRRLPQAIVATKIVLPDLCRIVSEYALPILFWRDPANRDQFAFVRHHFDYLRKAYEGRASLSSFRFY